MAQPIYVIGHKNSDLDSVASAYAYARLLQLEGEENAIAARNGVLKAEVRFVLERYQVESPEALDDVYLQVRDAMRRGVTCAHIDQPLLEAGQLLQEHNRRSMPVVDSENKVCGIIAVEDFAKLFFNELDSRTVNRLPLYRDNLIRVLKGRVLVEGRRGLGDRVLVGAMQAETMADYIEPGCLVILGDRVDAEGKLVGYLSRTDLLNARPKRIVLVDHNEQSQAVDGIEEAELLGIIDHHRIADVHTNKPIMFRADPVGCTGTIIAGLYHEADVPIPREVAGLLLGGLLYDTLILRSPTCTARDERVATELAEITREDVERSEEHTS